MRHTKSCTHAHTPRQLIANNAAPGTQLYTRINETLIDFFGEAVADSQSVSNTALIVVVACSVAIAVAASLYVPFLVAINRQRDCYIRCERMPTWIDWACSGVLPLTRVPRARGR